VILEITGQELHRYLGHTDRLGRIAIHPMGRHMGTASFDQTWRLWDLETGDCLLDQEGHSRSVYAVAFQADGALAASGGLDAVGTQPSLIPTTCVRPRKKLHRVQTSRPKSDIQEQKGLHCVQTLMPKSEAQEREGRSRSGCAVVL